MRKTVSVLLTIVAVSLWKLFALSSVVSYVGYTHLRESEGPTRELHYQHIDKSIDLLEPRVPFEYKLVETPKLVVDLISEVVALEKQKPDIENKEPGIDEIDGSSNIYKLRDYESRAKVIGNALLPIAEEITGRDLEPSALYGVREYLHGAYLEMHFDRRETHMYSFTCTHFKDADWPLRYTDSNGAYVDVEINAGQMLFYEGADYLHGRPSVFQGTSYMNWYMHFKPVENNNRTASTTSIW
jgi:hypothetical protein